MIRVDLTPGQLRAVLSVIGSHVDLWECDENTLIYQAERELDSALLAYESREVTK
jgi:hypothetical protein